MVQQVLSAASSATTTPSAPPVTPLTAAAVRAALPAEVQARIAYMRFGLGPKPNTPLHHWTTKGAAYLALKAELDSPSDALIPDRSMGVGKDPANNYYFRLRPGQIPDLYGVPTAQQCGQSYLASGPGKAEPGKIWLMADVRARYRKQQEPTIGFLERLVLFWSNHFSINWGKDYVTQGSTGHCERVAIRPHILGKYPDMLKAVLTHPAMIAYLDNQANIGPNSTWEQPEKKHLNENLAREVLELHTVTREAGYTQNDVYALACVLSGFAIDRTQGTAGFDPTRQESRDGLSAYFRKGHEPGSQRILGKDYPQTYRNANGQLYEPPASETAYQRSFKLSPDQAYTVMRDLALHPNTALNLAKKLIRHFISDTPRQDSIEKLVTAYGSDGDLKAMSLALLELPEAWNPQANRIRTPQLSQISINRALNFSAAQINAMSPLKEWIDGTFFHYLWKQNHTIWGRTTPDGYPDLNRLWYYGDALRLRTAYTYDYIARCLNLLNAKGLAHTVPSAAALAPQLFKNGGISSASLQLASTSGATKLSPNSSTATLPADNIANLTLLFMTSEFLFR